MHFAFGPFELDPARRRLMRHGEPVALSDRHVAVLLALTARAGQIVAKDDLISAGWDDVAVGDNSLEQAISSLRKVLGADCIETVPRRGYRFRAPVTRVAARATDAALDALLAPHRAFVEGRAALETLAADQITRARRVFEDAVAAAPDHAPAHIGLANACALQFEMTRADARPKTDALALGVAHAREACRIDPPSAEAWATLGFVLGRCGEAVDAVAALRRAVALEPDNWRHHLRLAYAAWGEERLRAAHRTLALLPDFPLARWLAATVYVARQVFPEAERELHAGIATVTDGAVDEARFTPVALHWLLGLLRLARGDEAGALEALERELALEASGHLYARECCANAWYAIGAIRLRQGRRTDAAAAFHQALQRIAAHPLAGAGLAAAEGRATPDAAASSASSSSPPAAGGAAPFERTLARAVSLALAGAHAEAARVVAAALDASPPGNTGWLLPLEPCLDVTRHPDVWVAPLARIRHRAA